MKKLFFLMAATYALTVLHSNTATAQSLNDGSQLMAKTTPHIVTNRFRSYGLPFGRAGSKAVRDFTKAFTEAVDVKWSMNEDGEMACFYEQGIKSRACYDKKGDFLYALRSYGEYILPKEIRAQVKRAWYDYAITWVNEITKGERVVYLVRMETSNHCQTIRVCEGEDMDVTESFNK